jgi:hypothetical protein
MSDQARFVCRVGLSSVATARLRVVGGVETDGFCGCLFVVG